MVTTYVDALINDRHEIVLPDFRRDFHADRPKWEVGRLDSCAELMTPGMVVYDIGAEHGDFTALYKKWVGDEGDVIPIEPAGHYWPFIRGTWEANALAPDPEICFRGLIADARASRTLAEVTHGWPRVTLGKGIPDGGFLHLAHDITSRRATIDDLASHKPPDAIVIDIEGAEWHALNGATNTLSFDQPIVWVSVHEPTMAEWYSKTLDDIHDLMAGFGYDGEELPHHGEGETFWLFRPVTG